MATKMDKSHKGVRLSVITVGAAGSRLDERETIDRGLYTGPPSFAFHQR